LVAAGECVDPKTKSFEVVKTALNDPLIVAKLHFMLSVGKQLQLFLVIYQTDVPMVTLYRPVRNDEDSNGQNCQVRCVETVEAPHES